MDLVCCLLQGAILPCSEAACLTMNCQTAELVQDCACRQEVHGCISRTPNTLRLQVDCHASSNASNTESPVGDKAKATMLPRIEYQPEQIR